MTEDILQEAETVLKDRENTHGSIQKTHQTIAEFWSAYLRARYNVDFDLKPSEAADMMDLLKDARKATGEQDKDTYRDGIGYNYCGWVCRQKEQK